jgi:hypothetical protein
MKTFICSYFWLLGYGAYDEIFAIVTAETKEVARGICLEKYLDTTIEGWTTSEIKTDEYFFEEISRRGN